MSDPHVVVTLTFATPTPPTHTAQDVLAAVAKHVPDPLTSISWDQFDLDDPCHRDTDPDCE